MYKKLPITKKWLVISTVTIYYDTQKLASERQATERGLEKSKV